MTCEPPRPSRGSQAKVLLALVSLALGGMLPAAAAAPDDATTAQGAISRARAEQGDSMREARKKAAHRTRRIIMNNDGNDAWRHQPGEAKTPEHFLGKRTSPLVGSQVDAIFYCTGVFNVYTHRSDETELRAHADRGVDDWAWELIQQGRDSLEIISDFGHQHGIEVFWSMRMNDTHDSGDGALFSRWKAEHPELLMGKKGDKFPYGGNRWSAVNYALPQVREKVFRILRDVCTRYDVDGVELDFYRHPVYFKPQMTGEPVTQEQCDLMTALLRRVRRMTDEVGRRRGRPLLIAVRVPDSVGFAKAIGLDLVAWLEGDLVDLVVGGGYFHFEPWEDLVALGRRYDAPVYACLSASRIVSPKDPESKGDIAQWRGEAMRAWEAGVSGIYTFNRFDPLDPIFRELGSPEVLKGLPRTYVLTPGRGMDHWLKGGSRFLKHGSRFS